MVDTPPGKWGAALVGPWWPAASTVQMLRGNAAKNAEEQAANEHHAQNLQNTRNLLSRNKGKTAEDLIERHWKGQMYHLDLAEKYKAKSEAYTSGADALDYLRERLTSVSLVGSDEIDQVLSSKKPFPEKLLEIQAIQTRCNGDATRASVTAVDHVVNATQKILNAEPEANGADARTWMRERGGLIDAQPPRQISEDDIKTALNSGGEPAFGGGGRDGGEGSSPSGNGTVQQVAFGSGGRDAAGGGQGTSTSGATDTSGGGGATAQPAAFGDAGHEGGVVPVAPAGGSAGGVAAGGGAPVGAGGAPKVGGVPAAGAPAVSGGGGLSPAALGQGLSPESLGQSFSSGAAAGQPAAAGAQSLSAGTVDAAASAAAPQQGAVAPVTHSVPVVSAPTMASGAEYAGAGVEHASAAPSPVSAAPVVSSGDGGASSVAPVVAGPVAATPAPPVAAAPAAPVGPLPAYGSDLRPPVVAPPAAPVAPAPPLSGAPVAPASAPSAGAPLVSPVERTAAGAAGQAGASPNAVAGASAAAAVSGAAAGDVSGRAAEKDELQRKVDAVARQERRISWAAGLRDDGSRKPLLVTDLAGGWIPPHVKLPANVELLEPARRRSGIGVVDLLGSVTVAAVHQPHGYVGEPGPDDPALTGERARYGHVVEELGPTLAEMARRSDGLHRLVLTAAQNVTRGGLAADEIEQFRQIEGQYRDRVLSAYPEHAPEHVTAWMLVSAIDALIDGHNELGAYHLVWAQVPR